MRIDCDQASLQLLDGQVVALPTETVYGLAASIAQPTAIASIFSIKGRPQDNPLIVHLSCKEEIFDFVENVPAGLDLLAKHFWPGPLTLVLSAQKDKVPSIVRAGLDTVAVRIPHHPLALDVIKKTGPLLMPSANLSGRPSATEPAHVEADFGAAFPVVDGGSCTHGVESTILLYQEDQWKIARQGFYSQEDFAPVLGYVPQITGTEGKRPLCPGQLYKHYAPKAKLLLGTSERCGYVIGFSSRTYPSGMTLFPLASMENPLEAARNLYSILRRLDLLGISKAWVDMDFPETGLWKTLRERLLKAAHTS